MNNKLTDIILNSKGCEKIRAWADGPPKMMTYITYLYHNTDWNRTNPAELWSLLSAMQTYAFKHQIVNFYEMVVRFTLSECFGEDY